MRRLLTDAEAAVRAWMALEEMSATARISR
jgi:hypothetical protein